MALVLSGECQGWDVETELLSNLHADADPLPHLPSQSRCNRRRRALMPLTNRVRRVLVRQLDLSQDRHCVLDSLPIPVGWFHLVPSATGD
jgi:hypothetical protein